MQAQPLQGEFTRSHRREALIHHLADFRTRFYLKPPDACPAQAPATCCVTGREMSTVPMPRVTTATVRAQQKISSPSGGASDEWESDCWERCPLPFFFFSFFSFGLAKLKRRVGIWVCSSAALLVWFVVLSKWKVLFSLCVLERLFLLGETDSSASKCPCLGREGLFCVEHSSMLDWEETLASFSCRFDT